MSNKEEETKFQFKGVFSESFWSKLSLRKSKMGSKGRNSSKTWFPINLGPEKNGTKPKSDEKKCFGSVDVRFFRKDLFRHLKKYIGEQNS